jgi:hypothetical protein
MSYRSPLLSNQEDDYEGGDRLRFRQVRIEQIYFKNWLCNDFKNSRYAFPDNIRDSRNRAIILIPFEIVCCFACVIFYLRRRNRLILALIIMNFIATLVGFNSKLTLSYYGLLAHACYAISFIGGFYVYIIIDYMLTSDRRAKQRDVDQNKETRLSDTTFLILGSVPFLLLFFMGIYSAVLLFKVDDELEARNQTEEVEAGGAQALR